LASRKERAALAVKIRRLEYPWPKGSIGNRGASREDAEESRPRSWSAPMKRGILPQASIGDAKTLDFDAIFVWHSTCSRAHGIFTV
jgi:hypothetical protein